MTPIYSAQFKERARSLYESLRSRTREKKNKNGRITRKGYELPFSMEEFRAWLLATFHSEDAPIQDKYTGEWITLYTCSMDHEIPLRRGGSPGLENLCPLAPANNNCKGKLTPDEFRFFRQCMHDMAARFGNTPVADITSRMEKATALAQQVNRFVARANTQKAQPSMPPARAAVRLPEVDDYFS